MSGGPRTSRTPTLGAVARAAGVSLQTVSNVLNAPHKVGAHTLARVEAEIASRGYVFASRHFTRTTATTGLK